MNPQSMILPAANPELAPWPPTANLNVEPRAEVLSGAEVIVRSLEQQGVRVIAGIPGGALLPLYEALSRCSRIRHVLARHEQSAGFIAQGMARITGRAAVCLATSGPGVTNILTALADAKLDSVPLVCIAGQVPTHLIGTDAFQEVATVDLAKPITKAAFFASRADELGELIAEAFRIAESGRPGPVLIDVPKDVQLQQCELRPRSAPTQPGAQERPPKCRSLYDEAAELLAKAERPVLYVGGGVVKARAEGVLRRLAEQAGIPVTTTLMALGALRHDHPLNLGMLGMHGSMVTHHVLEECDLLIAVGARFDDRATGKPDRFAPRAKIIHIDIDAREFGKIKQPDLAIHADAWTALVQLAARIRFGAKSRFDGWRNRVSDLRARYPSRAESSAAQPHAVIARVASHLPEDVIVTTDVGQHQMWVAQSFPFVRADRWLTSGGLGTMGFGLPAAMGAALAEPAATIACFTGDGSFLMNIQELATLAELKLNVKILLFDNASLGMVRQQQSLFYGRRLCASEYERPSDFVRIARAFDIDAIDLSTCSESEFGTALRRPGPVLIRIPIGAAEMVMPMVAAGAANIEALNVTQ
jgi:acetolactate synthase-1/2/3 large subunit